MTTRAERSPTAGPGRTGLVDLQINGIGTVDFWRADPSEWRHAGRRLAAAGVTSYVPTLPTGPLADYDAALDRIAAAQADAEESTDVDADPARIVGVHLEGPFLGRAPGAHPPELIRTMDADWLAARLDRHPGLVRIVTLAPEADPSGEGIAAATGRGVTVALGHSDCSYDDAMIAATAGASLVTHLFNGMGPFHHRDPGLVGAALDPSVGLTPTVIADGVHVHPAVIRALASVHCILISDAVATGRVGVGRAVHARDGAAFLADGTLAGATTPLDEAVRNVIAWGWTPEAAHAAASARPAELVDIDTRASGA